MRVGVTGATSGIGQEVVKVLESRGHTAVRIGRHPSGPADRRFDVHLVPDPLVVDELDGLVHLAWDWEAMAGGPSDPNASAGKSLADLCGKAGIKPVLLSTFSVFATPASSYGSAKLAVEEAFVGVGGTSLRAGLIWGENPTGIIATVLRLASMRLVCPHLTPDPFMYHSQQRELAGLLVDSALPEAPSRGVLLAVSPERVHLYELVHAADRGSHRVHVQIPVRALVGVSRTAEKAGIKLPFRADSLSGVGPAAEAAAARSGLPRVGDFPGREELLAWVGGVGARE